MVIELARADRLFLGRAVHYLVAEVGIHQLLRLRTPERIAEFFTGLEVVEPGWVSCSRWRPEPQDDGRLPVEVDQWCGMVRKP